MVHLHSAGWSSGDWHRPIINLPFHWCPLGFFLLPLFYFISFFTGVPLAFSSFLFFLFSSFFFFLFYYYFFILTSVLLIFKLFFIYFLLLSFFLSLLSFLFFSFLLSPPFFNLCLFNSLSSEYARFCNVYR